MNQDYIVYGIIGVVALYVLYLFVRKITLLGKKNRNYCDDCTLKKSCKSARSKGHC